MDVHYEMHSIFKQSNIEVNNDIDTELCHLYDSIKHGIATTNFVNGDKEFYNYINGLKQGSATMLYKNGIIEKYNYVNNIKEGHAIINFNSDKVFMKFNYCNGMKNGNAIFKMYDNKPIEITYKQNKLTNNKIIIEIMEYKNKIDCCYDLLYFYSCNK
jgi:antitoxin component YwqK of YwqJK toxin-antitoxin module